MEGSDLPEQQSRSFRDLNLNILKNKGRDLLGVSSTFQVPRGGKLSVPDRSAPRDSLNEEVYRKEAAVLLHRVMRDTRNKKLRKQKLLEERAQERKKNQLHDISSNDYVQARFCPTLFFDRVVANRPTTHTSALIEAFLQTDLQPSWRGSELDALSDERMKEGRTVDEVLHRRAAALADTLDEHAYSITMDFRDFPAVIKRYRSEGRRLKKVYIDGCAVCNLVNSNFVVTWKDTYGAEQTYQKNRTLLLRPIVYFLLRFLLMGHDTKVILPDYYKIPVFAGIRQKVDDLEVFRLLVENDLVQFMCVLEDEFMHKHVMDILLEDDAALVSSNEQKRSVERRGQLRNEEEVKATQSMVTPHFISPAIQSVCSLHYSVKKGHILGYEDIFFFSNNLKKDEAEQESMQLQLRDQTKKVRVLMNLFELERFALRGVQLLLKAVQLMERKAEEGRAIVASAPSQVPSLNH